jgi:hypothetical protein
MASKSMKRFRDNCRHSCGGALASMLSKTLIYAALKWYVPDPKPAPNSVQNSAPNKVQSNSVSKIRHPNSNT